MKDAKLLKRILDDKEYINSDYGINNESIDDMVEDYIHYLMDIGKIKIGDLLKDTNFLKSRSHQFQRIKEDYYYYLDDTDRALKPKYKEKINYIGIELECFTRYDKGELVERITDLGLETIVQAGSDGSVEAEFGDDCELRILLPEKQLGTGLKKVSKLLKKSHFGVNDSCGLHIHLDMRNRDVKKCYERLIKFQDILFGMVDKDRRNNSYCKFTTEHNKFDRHVAINKMAYETHKTIEVRLHHSTLDLKQVEKWVKLLLRIINSTSAPPKETKADVIKWAKKQKGLTSYITKTFDEMWFFEKEEPRDLAAGDWD